MYYLGYSLIYVAYSILIAVIKYVLTLFFIFALFLILLKFVDDRFKFPFLARIKYELEQKWRFNADETGFALEGILINICSIKNNCFQIEST